MYAIIMAGGQGTRFWPLSRVSSPKQVLKIVGNNTMIQDTVLRISSLIPLHHIYVVTNKRHLQKIKAQLKEICPKENLNFIIESVGKNTAPAIAVSAFYINEIDPQSIMVVLPADHIIQKKEEFLRLLRQAAEAARLGYLVTFGIKPNRPETGYGYIEGGEKISFGFKVKRFTEKPDLNAAKRYLKDPNYFWNGGIFVWQAKIILEEIKKYLPSLDERLNILRNASSQKEGLKRFYSEVEAISIDYAVMEHTDKALVIPADISWNDVGSWAALDEVAEKDQRGNIMVGSNIIDINSQNSIIYGGEKLVATIGLKDIVVVVTKNAVLVCPKDKSQEVKKIVDRLKEEKTMKYL
ncbi:mannose-1-phosphate guanylyltransferase [bacterium]|nr:mannose-1-phosphate guanylyltransferase [bacterium]MBU1781757.1 mannose-1-phosphate guanylyltransferase [bacterium]